MKRKDLSLYDNLVLIVLGNPPKKDGTLTYRLRSRLNVALSLTEHFKVSQIILSGGSVYNDLVEAEVMKKYCIDHGIPPTKIILETRAHNTYDNALYSAQIVAELKHEMIIVVTSHYHKRRTKYIFDRYFDEYMIVTPDVTLFTLIRHLPICFREWRLLWILTTKGDARLTRGRQGSS